MSEYSVCGILLMARPDRGPVVARTLQRMAGVDLHANDRGRRVVAVEGNPYLACANTITELTTLDGAALSSLVYHQIDTEDLL